MPSRSDGATVTETRSPFDFPPETKSITYRGIEYKFRELSLHENDLCRELATGPNDDYDGRVMIRQMIVMGAVEPEMTLDDLEKFPNRFYAQVVDLVNALNDPATFEVDPGNS